MPLSALLLPYRQIASGIAARLAEPRRGVDPLAPFAEEVIVASGGVASAIAGSLLEHLRTGVAGLRVLTIDALARRIVNDAGAFPHIASDAERRLAMRTATGNFTDPLFDSRGISSMLERSYRDVRDSGISLDEFERRVGRPGLRNTGRTRLILRAWRAYEELIAKLGAIDPADLLLDAARRIRNGAALRPQILAGFYDMTGVQSHIVDALSARGLLSIVFVPVRDTTGDYAFAADFVTARGEAVMAASPDPPQPLVIEHMTRGAEIDATCEAIARLLGEGTPPAAIAITSRRFDPLDASMLERAGRARGFAISSCREISLSAQRIGRAAITLLRIRDDSFLRGQVFELLRDGLRLRIHDIDRADAETRRHGVAAGTSSELAYLRGKSQGVADYVSVVEQLEELTATINVDFLALLSSRFKIASQADARAAESLDGIAALFRRTAVWRQPLDLNAVVDAIEQCTIEPFPMTDDSALPVIWTGDVMKLRGRSFDHVFSLRSEDEVLPQRRNEDPLLPDTDRERLGIRKIGTGEEEERLLFRLLCDSAGTSLTFSVAASDGFGRLLRPSRYIRDFERRKATTGQTTIAAAARRRPLQLYAQSGTGSPFDGVIGSLALLEVIRAEAASLSPTQLEDFGECPQKFFLKHILKVRDIDDPDRELQIAAREKGTLDHAILEKFYKALTRGELSEASISLPNLPPVLRERLDEIIDEEFDRFDVEHPAHNMTIRTIERGATRRILRDFVTRDLDELVESGLFPKHFEYRFGTRHRDPESIDHPEPYFVHTKSVTVPIEGTIDRIDRGGDALRVIDYKGGKATRHKNLEKKIARGTRLQLPLYAMAAADFFDTNPENVSGAIKPLVHNRGGKHEFALAATRDEVLATLELFIEAILAGRFPTFPDEDDDKVGSCKYCPVNDSCRTLHDADESREIRRFSDARALLSNEAETDA